MNKKSVENDKCKTKFHLTVTHLFYGPYLMKMKPNKDELILSLPLLIKQAVRTIRGNKE